LAPRLHRSRGQPRQEDEQTRDQCDPSSPP